MIVLNGKYNFAKVFLPKDTELDSVDGLPQYKYLDDATATQIISFLNHPAFKGRKIRIMPDVHFGKGSCVGFTMDLGEYIIPNIIGVDIGCGIMATKLPIKYSPELNLKALDEFIRENVPAGFKTHLGQTGEFLHSADKDALRETCNEVGADFNRALNSLGTLGGGNHFIELGRDDEGYLWLTIHSGSRNFGLQVATHFQKIADAECGSYFQDFGDLNFLPITSPYYAKYIESMRWAQLFASWNRHRMTQIILDGFFKRGYLQQIDSVHNYIDFHDNIIRKGSTSAQEGQKLVIPFNMEEGLIIGTGKGNSDWNFSAPHGAGRILSRNQAKKELSIDDARKGMESAGVYTTSLSQETLDEAKGAYKSKKLILDMINDTVTVDTFVKPIYNFKAK